MSNSVNIAFNSIPKQLVNSDGTPTPQTIRFLLGLWTAVNDSPSTLAGVTSLTEGLEVDVSLQEYKSFTIGNAADFGGGLTNNYFVKWNDADQRFSLSAVITAAAGNTGEVQFNSANAFAADSSLYWDNTNKRLGVGTNAPGNLAHIKGRIDEVQLKVQANGTQTANLLQLIDASAALGMGIAANGRDVILDATTGSKIGTSTTQKLAFFNKTPVVQQTGGVATAGGTYTATEQAMLQTAYDTLRTFGFLS